MKLKNRNPQDYVGRTILFRNDAWHIDAVDNTHVLVSKPGLQTTGKLMLELFAQCTLFPSPDEIRARYPKVLRALKAVCNLTSGEAENAVLGFIICGWSFKGSEALAHVGGSGNAINHCWIHRNRVRTSFA